MTVCHGVGCAGKREFYDRQRCLPDSLVGTDLEASLCINARVNVVYTRHWSAQPPSIPTSANNRSS